MPKSSRPLVLALVVGLVAVAVNGEPLEVDYVNRDEVRTLTAIKLCSADGCRTQAIPCGPGAQCQAIFDEPTGYREYWLHAVHGDSESPESQRRMRWVISDLDRYDANRDGRITTLDYPYFLDAYLEDQQQ